jgi:oxygen-independent coproporphyrinogen-3 oxidase
MDTNRYEHIEKVISEVELTYHSVLDLYNKTPLDTNPQNFECVSTYPSFSNLQEYVGDARNINPISDEIGIYIHFPFCKRSCDYCYYVKAETDNIEFIEKYIQAVKKEIQFYAEKIKHTTVKYIYFGGGTPTSIDKSLINDVINEIYSKLRVAEDVEFTCEGCPVTMSDDMLSFLSGVGVNRISVGIQSFDNDVLIAMNRGQTIPYVSTLITNLHKYFKNRFNIDMIFGHHASNIDILYKDLEMLRQYAIPSISYYQIWLCHPTPAKLKSTHITFDELLYQRMIIDAYLKNLNYKNDITDLYISNKDASFQFLQHKWTNKDHIGIGVGSHGYINGILYKNYGTAIGDGAQSIKGYIDLTNKNSHGINMLYTLSEQEIEKRRVFLGLKLNGYLEYSPIIEPIKKLINAKMIEKKDSYIKVSKHGFLMLNMVLKCLCGWRIWDEI